MRNADIAKLANVTPADVSNWLAGRFRYVTAEKAGRIVDVMSQSKAGLVLNHLSDPTHTITMQESLRWFGLAALSQTITRLKRQGHDIRNVGPGGPHDYAIYKLFTGEQK